MIQRTSCLKITPQPAGRAIASPHGPRPCLPFRHDSPSRKGFDGYLIANSIGGAA